MRRVQSPGRGSVGWAEAMLVQDITLPNHLITEHIMTAVTTAAPILRLMADILVVTAVDTEADLMEAEAIIDYGFKKCQR